MKKPKTDLYPKMGFKVQCKQDFAKLSEGSVYQIAGFGNAYLNGIKKDIWSLFNEKEIRTIAIFKETFNELYDKQILIDYEG